MGNLKTYPYEKSIEPNKDFYLFSVKKFGGHSFLI